LFNLLLIKPVYGKEFDKTRAIVKKYKYNGQALQDEFVVNILKHKKNGFFVEIGSADPIKINNTYTLEKEFDWKGFMIEINPSFLKLYKQYRDKSFHIINDATKIDYVKLFKDYNAPNNIDYLQIDLEVSNRSTLTTLEKINDTIMDKFKFAVITFEHDIYRGDYFFTRKKSRKILKDRGYLLVFSDVKHHVINNGSFEDWYVHPDLVDLDFINKIITKESLEYRAIMKRIRTLYTEQ
jgi:hypothetical protein